MKLTCSMNNNQKSKKERESKFTGELIDMNKVNIGRSFMQIFSQLHICKSPFQTQQQQKSQKNIRIPPSHPSTPSTTHSPATLFPSLPSLSPSLYHSYNLPYSFAQYIHSQCINKLTHICSDHEDSTMFIVKVIERYFYDMEYNHEVGCVLGQVSNLGEGRWEVVGEVVRRFPQVMKVRSVRVDLQLRERRDFIISFTMKSVSLHLGHVYSQLKSLNFTQNSTTSNHNKWPLLITHLFSSLLLQYLPPPLTPCLLNLYLSPPPTNDLYQSIYPYANFIKLLVSLFHYCHFMKKPNNVEEYYLLCSSPYMGLVEWPIVIANAREFDLPIPNIGGKIEKKEAKQKNNQKKFGQMIKEAQILE